MSSTGLDKLIQDFEFFREHCIQIRKEYNIYSNLFCEENRDVLSKVAATFFTDIAEIIHRDWKLQVCKIMDKASINGRENITLDLINKQLDDTSKNTQEIRDTYTHLKRFGKKLAAARNKHLAHFDRKFQIKGQPLGGTSEKDLSNFLNDMQRYCDQVGKAIDLGTLDFSCSACAGDELDLLKNLKAAVKKEEACSE